MTKIFSAIFDTLPGEVTAAIVLYLAGYATNELFDKLNQKRKVTLLTRRTEIAFQAIELAEKKFPKPKQGVKKLEFAIRHLMAEANVKKYEEAQKLILQCFPLTTLSHNSK